MDTNKLIIYMVVIAALTGAVFGYGSFKSAQGARMVQKEWDDAKILYNGRVLQQELQNKIDKERLEEQLANQKQELQNENTAIASELDRAIKRRLRIPAAACPAYSLASEADGPQGNHEAAASTVALPEKVADDLRRLMAEADGVTAQARAAQNFIRANGFGELDEPNK